MPGDPKRQFPRGLVALTCVVLVLSAALLGPRASRRGRILAMALVRVRAGLMVGRDGVLAVIVAGGVLLTLSTRVLRVALSRVAHAATVLSTIRARGGKAERFALAAEASVR
jgi:hypothetical protein